MLQKGLIKMERFLFFFVFVGEAGKKKLFVIWAGAGGLGGCVDCLLIENTEGEEVHKTQKATPNPP